MTNTTQITWGGETFTVPADSQDWDFDAVAAMERGQALTFVELMLGPAQMRTFKKAGGTTVRAGKEMMDRILDSTGAETPGE